MLAAPDGQLKVVDALGLRGPAIAAAIATGDLGALERLPNGALEAFITIPPLEDGTDESRALHAKAREIAARLR